MGVVNRFAHGGVAYPLAASTSNALLLDADPAIYYALRFFSSVLEDYVGPRLLAQAALVDLNFTAAVVETIAHEPRPNLLSEQMDFPILCLYRSETEWERQTKAYLTSTSTWEWAYVLPPLTPAQQTRLSPILQSVAVVMATFANQSFDPGYSDGDTLRDLSGIQKMTAGRTRWATFEHISENGQWWPAVSGQLMVQERSAIVEAAFERFKGVDITVDQQEYDGTVVPEVVVINTPGPIELASISPASGSKQGGTLVTIDTTEPCLSPGSPYSVLIGGAYASSVIVTHPTRLVCLTPEHDAQPTFAADVFVIGPGEQFSSVLDAAFTFTTP